MQAEAPFLRSESHMDKDAGVVSHSKDIFLAMYSVRRPLLEIVLWLAMISLAWSMRQIRKDMAESTQDHNACLGSLHRDIEDLHKSIQTLGGEMDNGAHSRRSPNSGKTTLVSVIANGQFTEDLIPTVGFNMRKVTKGSVVMKLWDLGGQARFRSMWERYCRGVNAIVYVVDSADHAKIESAKTELHTLLERPLLAGIPVLVLGNKNDLSDALTVEDLIEQLGLKSITNRQVSCYSISAKNSTNIDITLQWLMKHATSSECNCYPFDAFNHFRFVHLSSQT
ncbi:hypothetical protein BASA62_001928 [Batrachochytrium salamandrivorans]|nr:hypothetical protein BASA62_001928 [Batrachochytrium salamandrivorans]